MPRKKVEIGIKSFGLYTHWERDSKALPKLIKYTNEIEAVVGAEFGMTLSIKRAKGEMIDYIIHHPPFLDQSGSIPPSFEGSYFVNSNDFLFFLGDTVWEPVEDKRGVWTLIVMHQGKEIAKKSITLI